MPGPVQLAPLLVEDLELDAAMTWDTRSLSIYLRVRDATGNGVANLTADSFSVWRLCPGAPGSQWLANVEMMNAEIAGVGLYNLSLEPSPPNGNGLQQYAFLVSVSDGINFGRRLVSGTWAAD